MTRTNADISDLPLDLDAIAIWLREHGAMGDHQMENPRLLAGGSQNIVLRFGWGGRDCVLRHPPAKPRPNSNKLLTREIRVLSALEGSAVPHPRLLATSTDLSVTGTVFYVMEAVDGFNPTVETPAAVRQEPALRNRMGLELMDALAALSRIDPVAAGLSDFGKLDGFLERQVARWASELDSYDRFEGWDGPAALGNVGSVGKWLTDHCPKAMQPGIIHGDYHIGNGIFGEDGQLRAVVDWEMSTLGDPLVDLGRILISWPNGKSGRPHTMRVDPLGGYPSRSEMVARYAERSGRRLDDLPWFEVLACYKLGLILEGSHARAQAGLADMATGQRLHASAIALLDEARKIIADV